MELFHNCSFTKFINFHFLFGSVALQRRTISLNIPKINLYYLFTSLSFRLLCPFAQQSSINFGVESGKRHEFFSPHMPLHFPPLLSSFFSCQFCAGVSRELVSRWSWWKAALWAILSLPCAHGVSLHLTESTKLTGSGRHLNTGVRAQLSRLDFLCDSCCKHWGLIGGAVSEQPGFHHSFAEAQNSTELEQGGLTVEPDRGLANTHRLDC